jgi:hypothetical protein
MGPQGLTGRAGAAGSRGVSGQSVIPAGMIDKLAMELSEVQRTLEIQFARIAQLQAELDIMRAAPQPSRTH